MSCGNAPFTILFTIAKFCLIGLKFSNHYFHLPDVFNATSSIKVNAMSEAMYLLIPLIRVAIVVRIIISFSDPTRIEMFGFKEWFYSFNR